MGHIVIRTVEGYRVARLMMMDHRRVAIFRFVEEVAYTLPDDASSRARDLDDALVAECGAMTEAPIERAA